MKKIDKIDKLKKITYFNFFKECKVDKHSLVNKILEFCCEDNDLLDFFPPSDLMMDELQLTIYNDIKENGRTLTYIESNYDFTKSDLDIDLETAKDIYLELLKDKEVFKHIEKYVDNVDIVSDKNVLLKQLIENLENAIEREKINSKPVMTSFFEEDCGEFKKAYDYVNDISLPTGIDYYDKGVRRFNYPQSLGMVLLTTGAGKTFLMVQMAVANIKSNIKTLFLHGEMSRGEIVERFIPFLTEGKVTKTDILEGNLDKYREIRPRIKEKYGDLLHIVGPEFFNGPMKLATIRNLIKTIKPKVVIIDYLQLIEGVEDYKKPITQYLKNYCDMYNINIIVATQASVYARYDDNSDGYPNILHIEKCKSLVNFADWLIAGKTEYVEDINGLIYKFMVRKTRQGGAIGECPVKYNMIPNRGYFSRLTHD